MAKKNQTDANSEDENSRINLGLYGAAGSLGRQILIACEGEGITVESLLPVGSNTSIADDIHYQGRSWRVQNPTTVEPSTLDAAIIAIPEDSASDVVHSLHETGIFTIDVSGAGHTEYPITWPVKEYSDAIDDAGGVQIPGPIASTVSPVLQKFADAGQIASVHVVVLFTAGSQGRSGPNTLSSQTLDLLNFRIPQVSELDGLLAFNILPDSAGSSEQTKSRARREISSLVPNLSTEDVHVQCLRVPAFSGIACVLRVEFKDALPDAALSSATTANSEVILGSPASGLRECLESDAVLVSSIDRPDTNTICCVCFADPVHRTANAVGKMLQLFVKEGV